MIATFDVGRTPGLRDQIDAFRCASSEDDFVLCACMDEPGHPVPRRLECCSRAVAQFMDAAMDISVLPFVIVTQGVQHWHWLLRCSRIIEINKWIAVDCLIQD